MIRTVHLPTREGMPRYSLDVPAWSTLNRGTFCYHGRTFHTDCAGCWTRAADGDHVPEIEPVDVLELMGAASVWQGSTRGAIEGRDNIPGGFTVTTGDDAQNAPRHARYGETVDNATDGSYRLGTLCDTYTARPITTDSADPDPVTRVWVPVSRLGDNAGRVIVLNVPEPYGPVQHGPSVPWSMRHNLKVPTISGPNVWDMAEQIHHDGQSHGYRAESVSVRNAWTGIVKDLAAALTSVLCPVRKNAPASVTVERTDVVSDYVPVGQALTSGDGTYRIGPDLTLSIADGLLTVRLIGAEEQTRTAVGILPRTLAVWVTRATRKLIDQRAAALADLAADRAGETTELRPPIPMGADD